MNNLKYIPLESELKKNFFMILVFIVKTLKYTKN